MKRKDRQFSIPYHFKFVGLGLVVLTILGFVAMKTVLIEIEPEQKELVKTGLLTVHIIGCFLVVVSEAKLEDERSFYLKTKAFAGGFAGAIIYVIVKPYINLTLDAPSEVSGQEVALVMLYSHILTYYLQKFTGEVA